MANEEHLAILKQGVEAWNQWRRARPDVHVDLVGAGLAKINMVKANLTGADLREAYLREAHLSGATLLLADLRNANLSFARLDGANLRGANLRGTHLGGTHLGGASLLGAVLSNADLDGTDLTHTDIGHTILANLGLSRAEGLDAINHFGPSYVDLHTLYRSSGNIPEAFLRGCGVPDQFIEYARSLVGKAIEYYSCFISYSSKDEECAQRLHADLQANNVRCWFAPHDMPIGARIRPAIDDAIRLHDKLLLILSEPSVGSQWVEQEVERAMQKERDNPGITVLFPIRLDDAVMRIPGGWPNYLRNTRNIGDFTLWKDHDAYHKTFQRLLRDLKTVS